MIWYDISCIVATLLRILSVWHSRAVIGGSWCRWTLLDRSAGNERPENEWSWLLCLWCGSASRRRNAQFTPLDPTRQNCRVFVTLQRKLDNRKLPSTVNLKTGHIQNNICPVLAADAYETRQFCCVSRALWMGRTKTQQQNNSRLQTCIAQYDTRTRERGTTEWSFCARTAR